MNSLVGYLEWFKTKEETYIINPLSATETEHQFTIYIPGFLAGIFYLCPVLLHLSSTVAGLTEVNKWKEYGSCFPAKT